MYLAKLNNKIFGCTELRISVSEAKYLQYLSNLSELGAKGELVGGGRRSSCLNFFDPLRLIIMILHLYIAKTSIHTNIHTIHSSVCLSSVCRDVGVRLPEDIRV